MLVPQSRASRAPFKAIARIACTGPHARLTNADYVKILNRVLTMLRSIDEVNES